MLTIYDLKTEAMNCPNAVDETAPRFSWKISEGEQKRYRITAFSDEKIIWDSGCISSGQSIAVRYGGEKLHSRQCVKWRVEVSTKDDTALSEFAVFEMGLLEPSDWTAHWIEAEDIVDPEAEKPAVCLKKSFFVRSGLIRARIYQTAHGLYHFWLNGLSGTEDLFKPGFTSYHHRIQYQVYDILPLLHEGKNEWRVMLADGWWRGSTGGTVMNNFGYKLSFLGQLELTYADGSRDIISSDESFAWAYGPLRACDMMMGDVYDARIQPADWKPVHVVQDQARLIASASVPVRAMERFSPTVFTDRNGKTVLDFGQNIAGFVSMRLHHTKPGQIIRLIHGEGLKDGCFSIENISDTALKLPRFQEVVYICKGAENEEYCPMFSVFGFRYVLLEGVENPQCEDFTAIAVYSSMRETGFFHCSNAMINQLVSNSLWSQKGNFLDAATDCPTRERNTWTGDAQIYARTAMIFMDGQAFFEKWLKDQSIEQFSSGKVGITFPSTSSPHQESVLREMQKTNPLTALAGPKGNGSIGEDAVGWGDSAVWLPWMAYLSYGDRTILENQYDTARRWLEYELSQSRNPNPLYADHPQYHHVGTDGILDADYIYDTNFQYGEWNEARERTPEEQSELLMKLTRAQREGKSILEILAEEGKPEVATAYVFRSARTVSQMAGILGKAEDAARYSRIADRIKEVYTTYFIRPDGTIEPGHQAPYVRALTMGLYRDEKQKHQLAEKLEEEIHQHGDCLNTGFLSTPFLLPVLVDNGRTSLAYKILEQTENPSWLHAVDMGATTILEEWSGLDKFKASFNHYSYGAVCEFLFSYAAGIRPEFAHPGYQHFTLQPVPGGSLTEAEGRIDTPYGEIRSAWKITDELFHYECSVPGNTSATLILPNGEKHELSSGSYIFQTR